MTRYTGKLRLSRTQSISTRTRSSTSRFFSDAMFIALLTACGYLLAMLYEFAYFSHFQLPVFFLNPTPYVMLGSLIGVVTILVLGVPLMSGLMFALRVLPGEELRWNVGIGFLAWTGISLVFGVGSLSSIFAVGMALWSLLCIGRAAKRATGSFGSRLASGVRAPIAATQSPYMDALEQRFGLAPFFAGSVIYLAALCAYVSGSTMARFQTTFHVAVDQENTVVLRSYNDYVIGMEFDPKSRRATGQYTAIKVSDTSPLRIAKRTLGSIGAPL